MSGGFVAAGDIAIDPKTKTAYYPIGKEFVEAHKKLGGGTKTTEEADGFLSLDKALASGGDSPKPTPTQLQHCKDGVWKDVTWGNYGDEGPLFNANLEIIKFPERWAQVSTKGMDIATPKWQELKAHTSTTPTTFKVVEAKDRHYVMAYNVIPQAVIENMEIWHYLGRTEETASTDGLSFFGYPEDNLDLPSIPLGYFTTAGPGFTRMQFGFDVTTNNDGITLTPRKLDGKPDLPRAASIQFRWV